MKFDNLRSFKFSAMNDFDLDFEIVFENVAHFVIQLRALMNANKVKIDKN